MVRILSRRAGLSLAKRTLVGVIGVDNYRDKVDKKRCCHAEGARRVPALEVSHSSTFGPISSRRNEDSPKNEL
jgi:hypothetical protein